MRHHAHALRAVLAVTVVLFATACDGPSESPDAQTNRSAPTALATPLPSPTGIACIVGDWEFAGASWRGGAGDWWHEPDPVALEEFDGVDELFIEEDGTYSMNSAVTLASAGSPSRQLAMFGSETGTYSVTAATIVLSPSQTTITVRSTQNGDPVRSAESGLRAYPASYMCAGDALRLSRDSDRWVTHYLRT